MSYSLGLFILICFTNTMLLVSDSTNNKIDCIAALILFTGAFVVNIIIERLDTIIKLLEQGKSLL